MKSWPLILVFLLLGLCAFIVLTPSEQIPMDDASATAEEIVDTSTLGEPATNSTRELAAADALNRTDVASGPSEASLASSAVNALVFDRPAAVLKMRLVDGDGNGVADAGIRVGLSNRVPGIDWKAWKEQNLVHTDLDGKLIVDVPSNVGLRLKIEGSEWHQVGRKVQALAIGEEVNLGEIALAPANHMTGLVLGPNKTPIANAKISLEESSGSMWGSFGNKQTTSNEEGVYSFDGVRRGRYEINVLAQGFAPLKLDGQEIEQSKGRFELDLELEYGKNAGGQVVDEEGNPIPGAHIYLVSFDTNNYWRDYRPPLPKEDSEILSDEDGRFSVRGFSEETNMLLGAKAEGFGQAFAEDVKPNGNALIRLPRHYIVSGTVRDANGNPVNKARLDLASVTSEPEDSSNVQAYSKEDGSYEFRPQAPGSWNLSLSSPLGNLVAQPVQLNAELEPLDLVLPVQNPLSIEVVDADGQPLGGVQVGLSKPEQQDRLSSELMSLSYASSSGNFNFRGGRNFRNRLSVKTDENGIAHFADLDAEKYQMSLKLLGYALLEEDLDITGATQDEKFTLEDSGYLRVQLLNSNGDPVTQVQVGLRTTETGEDLAQKQTDDAGRAVWNDLKEGDYQVSYRANDTDGWWWDDDQEEDELTPDESMVSIKAGETKEIELIINDLALLTVVVTRHGMPAADVKVQLQEVKKERNGWGTDDNDGSPTDGRGAIVLPAVKAGTYDIVIKGRKASPATKERVELYVGPQTIDIALDGGEVRGALMGTQGPLAGATVALIPYFDAADGDKQEANQGMSIMAFSIGNGKPIIKVGKKGEDDTNTRSSTRGTYTFLDVPDGQWTIIARSDGYGTWTSQPISVQAGQNVDLGSHRLFPGGRITGHDENWVRPSAEDAENTWFGWGNQITLLNEKGQTESISMLDERGDYLFEDLPEGTYVIQAKKFKSEVIQLSPGGRVNRDIPLKQPDAEKEAD